MKKRGAFEGERVEEKKKERARKSDRKTHTDK